MPEVFKIDKKGKLGPDNVKPHTVVDKMCLPGLTENLPHFFLLVNAVLAFACPKPPEIWAKRPPFAKFCPPN